MRLDLREEGRRWLDQSQRDLDDARFSMEGSRHNIACFLSQQAAEKAVKAFLILRGEEDVWDQSVADLCHRAMQFDPSFRELRSFGAKLDRLYIPTRYPNGLPGGLPADAFDDEDAGSALSWADRIIHVVAAAFGG